MTANGDAFCSHPPNFSWYFCHNSFFLHIPPVVSDSQCDRRGWKEKNKEFSAETPTKI